MSLFGYLVIKSSWFTKSVRLQCAHTKSNEKNSKYYYSASLKFNDRGKLLVDVTDSKRFFFVCSSVHIIYTRNFNIFSCICRVYNFIWLHYIKWIFHCWLICIWIVFAKSDTKNNNQTCNSIISDHIQSRAASQYFMCIKSFVSIYIETVILSKLIRSIGGGNLRVDFAVRWMASIINWSGFYGLYKSQKDYESRIKKKRSIYFFDIYRCCRQHVQPPRIPCCAFQKSLKIIRR